MLQKMTKYFLIFFAVVLFSSCNNRASFYDRYAKLDKEEFVDHLVDTKSQSKEDKETRKASSPIPQISSMLSFPKPPEFSQGNQIISFSITDDVDLKDVLIELGRVTSLDIDIDPAISGGVIVNAKNRPLIEIIDRISRLGGLVYSFDNGVLTFKKDVPYSKHYIVDYLIDGALWDEVTTNVTNILTNVSTESPSVSPNKSASIITIFASADAQAEVSKYLAQVKRSASAQVLIEAKVVEVTLSDLYNAGIDWSFLDGGTSITSIPSTANANPLKIIAAGSGILGGDVGITISALEQFGTVRAISSPRISALNNQKANLDFVDKLVYFTLETESTTTSSTTAVTNNAVTATKNEEPVGVELEITPSIDIDNQVITMAVKPTLSIKSGDAVDPSVNPVTGLSLGNTVPIIQTREIQTTLKINNGDTLVIGGLMREDSSNTDRGVPFLSRIPLLGYLFKYSTKDTKIVETVIFIKATIVESARGVNKFDREFHNKFTTHKKSYF
jgi:general secretion pathway protein D